jgi:hypothetical protein
MRERDFKRLLRFGERWFELGLLTEDELLSLGREYEASDDKNTEHYRYRVFCAFLNTHSPLSQPLAEALYELGEADPDTGLGGAMQHDILRLPECPAALMHRALASGEPHLVKAVRRKELSMQLDSALTPETFALCLDSGDDAVQRKLLAHTEISREQVERLAQDGANRAVRNLATVRLRRKRVTA